MNDNENKKSGEELADEALDAVSGGGRKQYTRPTLCPLCGLRTASDYHDPKDPTKHMSICIVCAKGIGYVL